MEANEELQYSPISFIQSASISLGKLRGHTAVTISHLCHCCPGYVITYVRMAVECYAIMCLQCAGVVSSITAIGLSRINRISLTISLQNISL